MVQTVVILGAGNGSRISGWKGEVPKPLIPLCGMPMIERSIRSAKRAGFKNFVIVTGFRGDEIQAHLGSGTNFGVEIQYVSNPDWKKANGISLLKAEPFILEDDFALLMADHVVDPGTFEKLFNLTLRNDELVLMTDPRINQVFDLGDATKVKLSGQAIVDIGKTLKEYHAIDTGVFLCSTKIFKILHALESEKGDASLSDAVREIAKSGKARSENIGSGWWQDVDTAKAYRHAEKMLLKSLRKPTDVFVSRCFNRPISLWITKYMARTSIRPDVVSFFSIAAGMLSPLFLIQGEYWGFVLGTFFYHFSSVLDGCDGELARIKMIESHRGEWVDTIADVISHFLFVIGLSVGLYAQTGSPGVFTTGVLAIFGMTSLLYMMFQYLVKVANKGTLIAFERDYTQSVAHERDLVTTLVKLLKPLFRRATFAFLFFVLAVLGKIEWVFFLIAIGANAASVMVYMTFKRKLRAVAIRT